ncbi:hypothetical protein [Cupriavidus pauculus]|uniref:Uncharacterized protein n=1 Tax=Cupriavidus pauculus TaxID=82633 RepID=A0A2N5C354_9BURK|nr:hypothetical protein [Cupriavidus pauculus]PLP96645.1 hypothetical protein CYJ10_31005 [Cupriavidus pauculus]
MSTISKGDLQFTYSWTAIRGDDPRLTGKPDDVLLNRHEGYEVLPFINSFCSRHNFGGAQATKAHALKAERLIRNQLPSNIRSRQHVSEWLVKYWGTYQ